MLVGTAVLGAVLVLLALGWTMGSRLRNASAAGPDRAPVGVVPSEPAGPDGAGGTPTSTAVRRGAVSVFSQAAATTTTSVDPVPALTDPLGRALMVVAPVPTTTTVASTVVAPPAPSTAAASTTTAVPPIRRVTGVGDSIMVGAAERLADAVKDRLGATVEINARIGRPFGEGIQVVHDLVAAGQVGDAVIVHLGTNGPIDEAMVREMLDDFRSVPRVVVVNVRVPRDYEATVNDVLATVASTYPNVRLVDWYGATNGHPELFWSDGVHLRPGGSAFYAGLLADALAA